MGRRCPICGRGEAAAVRPSLRLLFDVGLDGFARWARRRLELLGLEVHVVPRHYKYDSFVALLADRLGAYIVTVDGDFSWHPKAIVLRPRRPKYEVMYTLLCRHLHDMRAGGR